MSSHDCRIIGSLSLRENVSLNEVHAAMFSILEAEGIDWDLLLSNGDVDLSQGRLSLHIDILAAHAYDSRVIGTLIVALDPLCQGLNWLELRDYDSGSLDDAICPYFLGADEVQRAGRVQYGLLKMAQWIEPVVGKSGVASITQFVTSLSNQSLPSSADVSAICTRLLDSEEHACEAAVPAVAYDAVDITTRLAAVLGISPQ